MTDQYLDAIAKNITAYCAEHFKFSFDPKNPAVRLHEPSFGADEINELVTQSL